MEDTLCPPDDAGFRLIETGLWTPDIGLHRRDLHLARLTRSAARLGIRPQGVEAALEAARFDGPTRLRLTVTRDGAAEVTGAPFAALAQDTVWTLAISGDRLRKDDPWLQVKTTERALYNAARTALPDGVDEMLFLNEEGALCEGTITNLFLETPEGMVTPPLADGCLPGILRQELLAKGARERRLFPADLSRGRIFVGNALRGLIPARL